MTMKNCSRNKRRHRKHKAERIRRKERGEKKKKKPDISDLLDKDGDVSFDKVFVYEHLLYGNRLCRREKRGKERVAEFDLNALEACTHLERFLANKSWRVGSYTRFMIYERGKPRHISAAPYHARVVQRVLHEYVLSPVVHKSFVKENTASQKGKGTDYSRGLLYHQLQKFSKKHKNGYVLICDLHNYFGSIPHEMLNDLYARYPLDKGILWLIRRIHQSVEVPGKPETMVGNPLGNEMSQTDGTLALNELDHMIKEKWHIEYFERYMDDFYLIHEDRTFLEKLLDKINKWLADHGLSANKQKTRIIPLSQGFNYLGFHWKIDKNNKVQVSLIKVKIKRHKDKMKKLHKKYLEGEIPFRTLHLCFISYINHISMNVDNKPRANTWCLRQKLKHDFCTLYKEELLEGIREGYVKDPRHPRKPTSPSPFPDNFTKDPLCRRFVREFNEIRENKRRAMESYLYETKLLESYGI